MFNLDEEKIKCALGNKEICFWQGKKAVKLYSDYRTRGIY